jgi:hypothetical protein
LAEYVREVSVAGLIGSHWRGADTGRIISSSKIAI